MPQFFSKAAREAGAVARRARFADRHETFGKAVPFAVRSGNAFRWELRVYGGVVIAASEDTFLSAEAALKAGTAFRGSVPVDTSRHVVKAI